MMTPPRKDTKRWTGKPVPHAVYRMYDADGDLLYIGSTRDVGQRMRNHVSYYTWVTQVTRVDLNWYPDIVTAREAEGRAIAEENPRHNIDGTRRGQGKFKGMPAAQPS